MLVIAIHVCSVVARVGFFSFFGKKGGWVDIFFICEWAAFYVGAERDNKLRVSPR